MMYGQSWSCDHHMIYPLDIQLHMLHSQALTPNFFVLKPQPYHSGHLHQVFKPSPPNLGRSLSSPVLHRRPEPSGQGTPSLVTLTLTPAGDLLCHIGGVPSHGVVSSFLHVCRELVHTAPVLGATGSSL